MFSNFEKENGYKYYFTNHTDSVDFIEFSYGKTRLFLKVFSGCY